MLLGAFLADAFKPRVKPLSHIPEGIAQQDTMPGAITPADGSPVRKTKVFLTTDPGSTQNRLDQTNADLAMARNDDRTQRTLPDQSHMIAVHPLDVVSGVLEDAHQILPSRRGQPGHAQGSPGWQGQHLLRHPAGGTISGATERKPTAERT
jgi:hypothetical protein